LISTRNSYHNSRIVNSVRKYYPGVEEKINNTKSYLSLHEINERLAAENIALRNNICKAGKKRRVHFFFLLMIHPQAAISSTSAEVIENSINRQRNFFTINKGNSQGYKS